MLLVVSVDTASAKKNKIIEKYTANAISMAGGAGSSIVEMNIYGWTPEEVRQELLDEVKKATGSKYNNRDVAKALRGQAKVGYAFLAGRQGYPIRYSRKAEHNGKTRIILATDRPVSFGEVYSQSQLGGLRRHDHHSGRGRERQGRGCAFGGNRSEMGRQQKRHSRHQRQLATGQAHRGQKNQIGGGAMNSNQNRSSALAGGVGVLCALILSVVAEPVLAKKKTIESFSANAFVMDGTPGGKTATLTVNI